jgi:hypothetical protein
MDDATEHGATDYRPVRPHPATFSDEQFLQDCTVRRTRHSGPGGQHRNKVETAIELIHRPTGLKTLAAERRSQPQNLQAAVFRLRLLIAVRVRSAWQSDVQPSQLWQQRCRNERISCRSTHRDFPSLLAEALDAADSKDGDVKRAAAALGCSATQWIRFVGQCPEALHRINSDRAARGQHLLKP